MQVWVVSACSGAPFLVDLGTGVAGGGWGGQVAGGCPAGPSAAPVDVCEAVRSAQVVAEGFAPEVCAAMNSRCMLGAGGGGTM